MASAAHVPTLNNLPTSTPVVGKSSSISVVLSSKPPRGIRIGLAHLSILKIPGGQLLFYVSMVSSTHMSKRRLLYFFPKLVQPPNPQASGQFID